MRKSSAHYRLVRISRQGGRSHEICPDEFIAIDRPLDKSYFVSDWINKEGRSRPNSSKAFGSDFVGCLFNFQGGIGWHQYEGGPSNSRHGAALESNRVGSNHWSCHPFSEPQGLANAGSKCVCLSMVSQKDSCATSTRPCAGS